MLFGLTLSFLASQILVVLALIFSVIGFQLKKRKSIILFLILGSLCIAFQYLLLERYVGASLVLIGITRNIISYYYPNTYFIPFFILLSGGSTALFWKDIYDILPFLGETFNTLGVFQKNDKYLRILMLFAPLFLITYYILVGSPMGIVFETIFFSANALGYWKYYIRKKN